MMARIVLLNGAGSVGKSSIARAIQALARDIYLHVQMDTFLEMMPARTLNAPEGLRFETVEIGGKPVTHVHSGLAQARALNGMRHAIAAMAAEGNNMIVDDVLFPGDLDAYCTLLTAHDFKRVGLHAPLDVLETREHARGDRILGLSRAQIDLVHKGAAYDLELDTGALSIQQCAQRIVEALDL